MANDPMTKDLPTWPSRRLLDLYDVELLAREPFYKFWCGRCGNSFHPHLTAPGKPRRGALACPRGCSKGLNRRTR